MTKKTTVWYRYIDDIFFIWEHGEDTLTEWLKYLNKYHKSIKFTAEISKTEIAFLDTKVKKTNNGKLYTDLFVKPTDTNSYLKYDSAHPPQCKQSLPYSQMLRIKRICNDNDDFNKHVKSKRDEFAEKGYPQDILDRAEEQFSKRSRSELLKQKEPKDKNETPERIFLTVTYREGHQYVPKIVKNNWDILARSSTTKGFHRADLMIGYRKPRDIRSYLVKAKIKYHNTEKVKGKGSCAENENKCTKRDCRYCNIIDKSGSIQNGNRKFSSKTEVTCNSSNLIYCIECTKCNKKHVGQTKRKIKGRLREHIYGIKNQKDSDISYHFNTNGHHGIHDMKVYILDFIHAHPESKRARSLRNTIEFRYIHRIGTNAPRGMNVLDNRYG